MIRSHLKERGVWYFVGMGLFLALVIPGFYARLGPTTGFAMAVLAMSAVAAGASVVVLAVWMLLSGWRP